MLVEGGLVDVSQLDRVLELQRERGTRLGTQLLLEGFLSEAQLAGFLSEQLGLPSICSLTEIDPAAPRMLPASVAVRYGLLPVRVVSGGLMVALADPSDEAALAAARRVSGREIFPAVAPELVVAYGIRRFYAPDSDHHPEPESARPQFARDAVGLDALDS